jgi:hypothetical protein
MTPFQIVAKSNDLSRARCRCIVNRLADGFTIAERNGQVSEVSGSAKTIFWLKLRLLKIEGCVHNENGKVGVWWSVDSGVWGALYRIADIPEGQVALLSGGVQSVVKLW